MASELVDLFSDDQGEIFVGHNGDLQIARDDEVLVQEVVMRLKTTKGDWQLVPECGADLELLIGEPQLPQTGAMMENQISEALTNDGFFSGRLVRVKAVPINWQQLKGIVELEGIDSDFGVAMDLDLKEGVLG
jgi:hypothetical protein